MTEPLTSERFIDELVAHRRLTADEANALSGVVRADLDAARKASRGSGLDVAWERVETALPEGWRGPVLRRSYDFPDQYWALAAQDSSDNFREGYGPTPAEALDALAAALDQTP